MSRDISTAIKALEGYADMLDDEEWPEFATPFESEMAEYLDDTYKKAVQDCITILKTVLDNQKSRV
jgi:hypothetical protein